MAHELTARDASRVWRDPDEVAILRFIGATVDDILIAHSKRAPIFLRPALALRGGSDEIVARAWEEPGCGIRRRRRRNDT